MKSYQPRGNIIDADCVIGHSFGTSIDPGSVNEQLARQMLRHADGLPMIADRTLVNALPEIEPQMSHIVEGPVTNINAQGVGTWGTLVEARQHMESLGLSSPAMVAQAWHIGRVVKQAARLEIDSIVPEGLPKDFDPNSDQIWTRSVYLWVPFNALGSLLLKARGQL